MRANFKWIDLNYRLNDADKIILAGSTIGGIATLLWIDYLKSMVTSDPDKVYGIIDSALVPTPGIPELLQRNSQLISQHLNIPLALPPPQQPIVSQNIGEKSRNPEGIYLLTQQQVG